MNLLTLALSLLILAGLFALHFRQLDRAYWCGWNARGPVVAPDTHGLSPLPSGANHDYASGYADGYALGFAKAQAEAEVSTAKAYEAGYNRALVELSEEIQAERGGEYHAISA
jgi:hypothetical protein